LIYNAVQINNCEFRYIESSLHYKRVGLIKKNHKIIIMQFTTTITTYTQIYVFHVSLLNVMLPSRSHHEYLEIIIGTMKNTSVHK